MEPTVTIALKVDFTKLRTMCLFHNLFKHIVQLTTVNQMMEYHANNLQGQIVTVQLDICVQPTII